MIITRLGTKADIIGILSLQKRNLVSNLSEAEKENGFVTTPFTTSQIEAIIKEDGIFVAETKDHKIVAYVFAASWEYFKQWEIFNYMVSRFPKLSFNEKEITVKNSFQYGPVCIDKEYRGQGLLNQIFEAMRLVFVKRYPIGITFINKINTISLRAHSKLGWSVVDEFTYNNGKYISLGIDMNISVVEKGNTE